MIPAPTKVGFWKRKTLPCYCMAFDFQNPHGWVRAYCPPEPTPAAASEAVDRRRG